MKKIIPFVILGVVALLVVIFFVAKGIKKSAGTESEEETVVAVLPESEWPAVSLTPTSDDRAPNSLGHYLDLKVEKINVTGASSMDYLLVYSTSDGGQQGVPGTVKLTGTEIERKLLMGSESSGKFRYDAGVNSGTLTITFRNSNGKTIGKLSTDFHLQFNATELTSMDGLFKYTLDKAAKNVYFVTMKTFLEPAVSTFWKNGYGVFASDGKPHTGKAE